MTTTPMTCAEFDARFQDFLEGTLDAASAANADAHLAQCARCRGLVSDIAELRSDASRLPALAPSRDLWDGISARIETPAIAITHRGTPIRFWQRPAWLAAAALLLMTATAATTWSIARRADTSDTPSARVAATYASDIAQLSKTVAARPPALDSATAQVLASSMRTIDNAIARVRTALDAAPSNLVLAQELAHAYDMKLSTLRLIATMQTE